MPVWWSHLDPAVAGGIVGALIGGAFTVIGGFGGAWLVGWLEARHEEREQVRAHSAAVRAVFYEMVTIMSGLGTILDSRSYLSTDLPDWAFRSVHMDLIERLPEDIAQRVAFAYSQLHIARHVLDHPSPGGNLRWDVLEHVEQSIGQAFESLRDYAETSLHVDVRTPALIRREVRRAKDAQGGTPP